MDKASLVLGIIAFLPFVLFPFDLIVAAAGLVIGIAARRILLKAGEFTAIATAGIVLSSITLGIAVLGRLLWIVL